MGYPQNPKLLKASLTTGFSEIIQDRIDAGYSCDLVTILFNQMNGSQPKLIDQMRDQIQQVYSTFVTRVNRKPRAVPNHQLPLLIGALDLPVYKKDRASAPSVLLNGGLHFHGALMVPPNSRLKDEVANHFATKFDLYGGHSTGIARIDIRPVTHDRVKVLDYILKTIGNGRLSYDDAIVVLPRSRTELSVHRRNLSLA